MNSPGLSIEPVSARQAEVAALMNALTAGLAGGGYAPGMQRDLG